jgi:RNA polymerase primary sigma factor
VEHAGRMLVDTRTAPWAPATMEVWRSRRAAQQGLPREAVRIPLSVERRLVAAAAAGDPVARDRLIEAFVPSVGSIARRYRGYMSVSHGELMQEGVVGLLRALQRYDLGRGTPFWAYASWWVRQAMQDLVSELTRPVVLSDRALRQLARVKDAQRTHLQAHGREPSTAEIATATGLNRDQIQSLMAVDRTPRSLAEPLGGGEDEGARTIGEQLADPRGDDDQQRVFRRVETEALGRLRGTLCERENDILRARYGLGCREHTLQEIANSHGLSAERVRQIEQRALDKLRAAAETKLPCRPRPAPARSAVGAAG